MVPTSSQPLPAAPGIHDEMFHAGQRPRGHYAEYAAWLDSMSGEQMAA